MGKTGLELILATSKLVKDRTHTDVMYKVMEEIGELSTELNIKSGFVDPSKGGSDGVTGEAIDAIIALMDIVYLEKPNITIDEILDIISLKVQKWYNIRKKEKQEPKNYHGLLFDTDMCLPPTKNHLHGIDFYKSNTHISIFDHKDESLVNVKFQDMSDGVYGMVHSFIDSKVRTTTIEDIRADIFITDNGTIEVYFPEFDHKQIFGKVNQYLYTLLMQSIVRVKSGTNIAQVDLDVLNGIDDALHFTSKYAYKITHGTDVYFNQLKNHVNKSGSQILPRILMHMINEDHSKFSTRFRILLPDDGIMSEKEIQGIIDNNLNYLKYVRKSN